jgi:hypothetical protein
MGGKINEAIEQGNIPVFFTNNTIFDLAVVELPRLTLPHCHSDK